MAEIIERLRELQSLDLALGERRKICADFPADQAALDQEHAQAKAELEQKREELQGLQKERRRKEGALQDGEEQLKKSQGKLYAVKTNKEYEATLKEIEGLKGKNSGLEEQVLLLYDELEAAETGLKRSEQDWQSSELEFERRRRELAERRDLAEAEIKEMEAKRGQAAAQVGEGVLVNYERLRRGLGDPVVVPAEKEICTACNRMVPAQLYIQVLRNEQVMLCPHCGRYLVHAPVAPNPPPVESADD